MLTLLLWASLTKMPSIRFSGLSKATVLVLLSFTLRTSAQAQDYGSYGAQYAQQAQYGAQQAQQQYGAGQPYGAQGQYGQAQGQYPGIGAFNDPGQAGQQAYQSGQYGQQAYPGAQYQQQGQYQQNYQDPSAQYGQSQAQAQPDPTYYGYAADMSQGQGQMNQGQMNQPYQQYAQGQSGQPVYGQQAQAAPGQGQQNLEQFLEQSDQSKKQKSGPGNASKIMHAGGGLAKVAGNMAAGYFMGKAVQKQYSNLGVKTSGLPMTGMMSGLAGNPMGVAAPMGGYGMGGYGMGGYGGYGYGMPMGAPLGANVMNGLNNLIRY